jgi:hypothetical protein
MLKTLLSPLELNQFEYYCNLKESETTGIEANQFVNLKCERKSKKVTK